MTLAAVKSTAPADIITHICDQRICYLRQLPTFDTFGRGWTTRVADVRRQAEAML